MICFGWSGGSSSHYLREILLSQKFLSDLIVDKKISDVVAVEEELALTENVVSVWDFNETSGTILNDIHGSNNGTISGATLNQAGVLGTSYLFDGTNDFITLTENVPLTGAFSISVWMNTPSTTTNLTICNFGQMWYARRRSNLDGKLSAGGSYLGSAPTDNTDYMATFTYDGATLKIFEGETEVGSYAAPSLTVSDAVTYIGRISSGQYFKGNMSYLSLWSRALSLANISELHNGGSGLAYGNW